MQVRYRYSTTSGCSSLSCIPLTVNPPHAENSNHALTHTWKVCGPISLFSIIGEHCSSPPPDWRKWSYGQWACVLILVNSVA